MAHLPVHRLAEAPPFTYCGAHMFDPFVIKQRRNEIKSYRAIFTCMTSRAVHIEITHSLDSASFIQALRRVFAYRGNIKVFYSDNGTKFVGCANKLKKAYKEIDNERIQYFMESFGGDLMKGIWEKQIRSARAILSPLFSAHVKLLEEESLLTLVAETEGILN